MKSNKIFLFSCLTLIQLFCAAHATATTLASATVPTQAAAPSAAALLAGMPLEGLWAQPCTNGTLRTESFAGANVSLGEMFFQDKDCRFPNIIFVNDGSFVLPAAGQIDFKFTSVRLRLMGAKALSDFNQRAVCGFTDWELNREKEISGRSCEIFVIGFPQRIPTAGDMRYGIYRLDPAPESDHGLDQPKLYFGKLSRAKNASTPEARPTEFDPRFYLKVSHRRADPTQP